MQILLFSIRAILYSRKTCFDCAEISDNRKVRQYEELLLIWLEVEQHRGKTVLMITTISMRGGGGLFVCFDSEDCNRLKLMAELASNAHSPKLLDLNLSQQRKWISRVSAEFPLRQ